MERIFEFDNKNEVKLIVDGFDKAPILMGSEQSNGIIELEKSPFYYNHHYNKNLFKQNYWWMLSIGESFYIA